jgi:hypothetical protein
VRHDGISRLWYSTTGPTGVLHKVVDSMTVLFPNRRFINSV